MALAAASLTRRRDSTLAWSCPLGVSGLGSGYYRIASIGAGPHREGGCGVLELVNRQGAADDSPRDLGLLEIDALN
jgi:hypothetical protein